MKKYTNTGSKDTRSGFGAGMTELGQKNENVVALCADLIGSLKLDEFEINVLPGRSKCCINRLINTFGPSCNSIICYPVKNVVLIFIYYIS